MGITRRELLKVSTAGVGLGLSACGGGGGSDTSGPWTVVSRGPQEFFLTNIRYGAGKFVALGSNGIGPNKSIPATNAVSVSLDGQHWTAVIIPPKSDHDKPNGLAFGNGRFVLVSWQCVRVGTDGMNWTESFPQGFSSLVFGDGTFFAGITYTSNDGANWTGPAEEPHYGKGYGPFIRYGLMNYVNGKLFARIDEILAWSDDGGITWWNTGVGGPAGIAYGNGFYVALSHVAVEIAVYVSTDLVNWTYSYQMPSSGTVKFANGTFIFVGDQRIATSTDGKNWSLNTIGQSGDMSYSIEALGANVVIVGSPGLTINGSVPA